MPATAIRMTCSGCQVRNDVPSTRLVLALPAASDATTMPPAVHIRPRCTAADLAAASSRTAVYLLAAGATTLTCPSADQLAPQCPDTHPVLTNQMPLDDHIDLLAATDAPDTDAS